MLLKLLKLNANDAISSGATATSSSGSVTLRNTCHAPPPSTRAASVSSAGIDCSAPSETRKKYGNVSQTLTRMHRDLRPPRVEEPRDVDVEDLVDDPEVVVQQPLPDEQRQEARDRVRDDEQRPVELWKRIPGLSSAIARKRPSANETTTASVAKTNVQTKTRRNGLRISGSWMIRLKLPEPM